MKLSLRLVKETNRNFDHIEFSYFWFNFGRRYFVRIWRKETEKNYYSGLYPFGQAESNNKFTAYRMALKDLNANKTVQEKINERN